MGISRQKEITAKASMDMLKIIVHLGDGVMAQQHIFKYMNGLTKRKEHQIRREIDDLEKHGILIKQKLQRLVIWTTSKYAKALVLNKCTTKTQYSGKTVQSLIRSLTYNEYILSRKTIKWEQHTADTLIQNLMSITTMFYRTREGFKFLELYLDNGIIKPNRLLDDEVDYLKNVFLKTTQKPYDETVERPPLLDKLPTLNGLQQMHFHLYRKNKIIHVKFFECENKYSGKEFMIRLEKASKYIQQIITETSEQIVFEIYARNEERKEYFEKHFEPQKKQFEQSGVFVNFDILNIDDRFFKGQRVLFA